MGLQGREAGIDWIPQAKVQSRVMPEGVSRILARLGKRRNQVLVDGEVDSLEVRYELEQGLLKVGMGGVE